MIVDGSGTEAGAVTREPPVSVPRFNGVGEVNTALPGKDWSPLITCNGFGDEGGPKGEVTGVTSKPGESFKEWVSGPMVTLGDG